jgi:lipoate-protein ligase A
LRFYAWSPPTLSLGYAQAIETAIDLAWCRAHGIDVVRRPTGGRAVLHDQEVTYSLVLSADDPRVNTGILAAYLTIGQALVRGLSYLDITSELLPPRRRALPPPEPVSAVCFATAASYEVAVQGRKLIGSAQRRLRGAIMQHGSIPLAIDRDKLDAIFSLLRQGVCALPPGDDYHSRMTSLQEAGGRVYDYAAVVAALTRGMAETWQVELIPGQLTASEHQLSAHLSATKYRSEAWTMGQW